MPVTSLLIDTEAIFYFSHIETSRQANTVPQKHHSPLAPSQHSVLCVFTPTPHSSSMTRASFASVLLARSRRAHLRARPSPPHPCSPRRGPGVGETFGASSLDDHGGCEEHSS